MSISKNTNFVAGYLKQYAIDLGVFWVNISSHYEIPQHAKDRAKMEKIKARNKKNQIIKL